MLKRPHIYAYIDVDAHIMLLAVQFALTNRLHFVNIPQQVGTVASGHFMPKKARRES